MKIVSMQDIEDVATQVNKAYAEQQARITALEERVEALVKASNRSKPLKAK